MSTNGKIKTKCPICEAKYYVPASALGHKARCGKCKTRFQVLEYKHHPTEEDILQWLNEEIDETDIPVRPRVIKDDVPSAESIPVADNSQELPDTEYTEPIPTDLLPRLRISSPELSSGGKLFRKTG